MKKKILFFFLAFVLILQVSCTKTEDVKKEMPITTNSEKALSLIIEGRGLSEESNLKFVEYFEKAIKLDSNCAVAYYYAAFGQNSAEDVYTYLNKANELVENASEGEKYLINGIYAQYGKSDYQEAEKYLGKLTTLYPADKRAWSELGYCYYRQQKYQSAIEYLKKAVDLDSTFAEPYNLIGYAYSSLENYNEAEKALKKYAELLPKSANPHDSYAEILMKQGKFDESIKEYEKALSIDSTFFLSYIGLGTNYIFKGNYERAREQFKKLFNPESEVDGLYNAYVALASSYIYEGRYADAINELEKVYKITAAKQNYIDMASYNAMIGDVLFESGKPDAAKEKYVTALEQMQNSSIATEEQKVSAKQTFTRNEVLIALKKNQINSAKEKQKEYRQQIENSNNPRAIKFAHYLSGMIALHEKRYENAIDELLQANQRDPQVLFKIAEASEGLGNKEKAKEFYSKVANFNEISTEYAFVRNKAIKKLKDYY